jgi:hypothetical protein
MRLLLPSLMLFIVMASNMQAQSSSSYTLLFDVFDSGGSGPSLSASSSWRAHSIVGQAAQRNISTSNTWTASSGGECVFCEFFVSTVLGPTVIPGLLRLHQNYPNPFNPSSTIRYDLERPAVVELAVYTLLGSKLTVLDKGFRDAGPHSVDVYAGQLGSGVYVYRLTTEGGSLSRKMVILR